MKKLFITKNFVVNKNLEKYYFGFWQDLESEKITPRLLISLNFGFWRQTD